MKIEPVIEFSHSQKKCNICANETPIQELSVVSFESNRFPPAILDMPLLSDKVLKFYICNSCYHVMDTILAKRFIAASLENNAPFIDQDMNMGYGYQSVEEIPSDEWDKYTPELQQTILGLIEEGNKI